MLYMIFNSYIKTKPQRNIGKLLKDIDSCDILESNIQLKFMLQKRSRNVTIKQEKILFKLSNEHRNQDYKISKLTP